MIAKTLKKIFGSKNDRILKKHYAILKEINKLEKKFIELSDIELKQYAINLKDKVINGLSLEEVKNEAFAVCRETSKRILGMRHFDVQILGGLVLHEGCISEMRTGEGKTLVATLAVYLNALSGNGVHVVTVNDYLAKRDAELMRPLYENLGLTVGANISGLNFEDKKQIYKNDIIYGTNSEFGFDYLKNNLVLNIEEKTHKNLNFALIDEVDSILIDEARTPLIISDVSDEPSSIFIYINQFINKLKIGTQEDNTKDFWIDEEKRIIHITENGYKNIENFLIEEKILKNHSDMYHDLGLKYLHHINNALKAKYLFLNNKQYLVKDGEIVIVDEFTGRISEGRRWSDGLHQAIEAKENVEIKKESKTLATITYQNYFLLYNKIAGMTGTADTEATEFYDIYKLETVIIPTNNEIKRIDHGDIVFAKQSDKLKSILEEVIKSHNKGQPILIGTASIENSELVANLLNTKGLKYNLLNAKNHNKEALIISQAGRLNSITIATNMAGRGTDIILGGNINSILCDIENSSNITLEEKKSLILEHKIAWEKEHHEVILSGGLKVIGFEKNESRRIDNQLRGRSGRQGDPGESIFFISFEDDLFRIFGGESLNKFLSGLSSYEGLQLQNSFVNNMLKKAQIKLENQNYEVRKNLIDFDKILNEQRKTFYLLRDNILEENNSVFSYVDEMFKYFIEDILKNNNIVSNSIYEEWNFKDFKETIKQFDIKNVINDLDMLIDKDNTYISNYIYKHLINIYEDKIAVLDTLNRNYIERTIILSTMDKYWQSHITNLDKIKDFIHLRAYAQKDPKQEYKKEAHEGFLHLFNNVKIEVSELLLNLKITTNDYESIEEITEFKEDTQEKIKEYS